MPPNSEAVLSSEPSAPNTPKATSNWRNYVVIAAIVAISFIFLLTLLLLHFKDKPITANINKPGNTTKQSENEQIEICQTEACVAAGKWLYESINFTANPCDNFYEFTCGNWVANNPIPDDKTSFDTFSLLQDKVTKSLRQLLESKPSEGPVAKSVQIALDLYRECMDQETRDRLGLVPMKQQLSLILNTSWPILNSDQFNSQNMSNSSFIETFTLFKTFGISPMINFHIREDLNNTQTKILYFDAPNFSLGRKQYANQTEYKSEVAAFRKYMHDVAARYAGEVDGQLLQARLDEIFEFERKLALAERPPEESRNAKVWYNKISLAEFKNITSNVIDWTALLQLYTGPFNLTYSFTDANLVIVSDISYYQEMCQLVLDTPGHVLYNYMGYRFASGFSSCADGQMRIIDFEYDKAKDGIKEMQPLWEACFDTAYSRLSMAVAQLYVKHLVVPGTKERAEEMIADIKSAFRHIVESETPWLDETTRARALEKESVMHYFVAYPEWIQDNAELDNYFGFTNNTSITMKKSRYFETLVDVYRFNQVHLYRKMHEPRNKTREWTMAPTEVNASAGLRANTVALPAAILQPPFFDTARPAYLNYGSVGEIIAHEITHHVDDEGSQHDKYGNLNNWWTEETKKRFDNASQCFIEQYGAIVDTVTGKKLNAVNTLGENIADNGAVRDAFYAFQLMAKRSKLQLVPQMDAFTFEQLFFLSFAKNYCGVYRVEALKRNIDYNRHSPDTYRANVALGNFDQFAKAFDCPAGSPMNPLQKCRLW